MFILESILKSIAKFTTKEAVRCGDVNFSLSLNELETFFLAYTPGGCREKIILLHCCKTRVKGDTASQRLTDHPLQWT